MALATSLQQFLDRQSIPYRLIEHAHAATMREVAHCAGVPEACVVKAVLVEDDDGFMLAAVPASCDVELDRLSRAVKRPVELATESDIMSLFTDCARGALPPLGSAYGVEVVVDRRLDAMADLYFEGGDHRTLVHVTGEDFRRLMPEARHARISVTH
jgi:Ala-tRNA(Pro) deacylase